MAKIDTAKFRALLEEELVEVKATHDLHRKSLQSGEDRLGVESGDLGQAREDETVEKQIVLNDEYYMEKIQAALVRIDEGTYGTCEGCGQDIPLARLEAKPSVSLCIDCQSEKEGG